MSSLSLNGLPIRADQHGRHQAKGAKAWKVGRHPLGAGTFPQATGVEPTCPPAVVAASLLCLHPPPPITGRTETVSGLSTLVLGLQAPVQGRGALRGGCHQPVSIILHPLPPGAPESMVPPGHKIPQNSAHPPWLVTRRLIQAERIKPAASCFTVITSSALSGHFKAL